MNRINELFSRKHHDILSLYFCAGSPTLEGTATVIKTLEQKGIDMIEIGIPFSDPMADGVVIQNAATQALRNGMTLRKLFDQLKEIRQEVSIPLILMGYLNPIMQYGFENFCKSCQSCGIIMLITPETSEARVREIDQHTDGFIYMVSSAATTGAQTNFNEERQAYFCRIENMQLRNPRMVGFGISNKQTYETAASHASGCIIGSKFITLLDEEHGNADRAAERLMHLLGR